MQFNGLAARETQTAIPVSVRQVIPGQVLGRLQPPPGDAAAQHEHRRRLLPVVPVLLLVQAVGLQKVLGVLGEARIRAGRFFGQGAAQMPALAFQGFQGAFSHDGFSKVGK
jgi:hypothetical protein